MNILFRLIFYLYLPMFGLRRVWSGNINTFAKRDCMLVFETKINLSRNNNFMEDSVVLCTKKIMKTGSICEGWHSSEVEWKELVLHWWLSKEPSAHSYTQRKPNLYSLAPVAIHWIRTAAEQNLISRFLCTWCCLSDSDGLSYFPQWCTVIHLLISDSYPIISLSYLWLLET